MGILFVKKSSRINEKKKNHKMSSDSKRPFKSSGKFVQVVHLMIRTSMEILFDSFRRASSFNPRRFVFSKRRDYEKGDNELREMTVLMKVH